MSFDTSRFTFDPFKNYTGVVMEQGRVQLDSDWNDWLAQLLRRIQAGTLDMLGHAAYPATTPYAFLINLDGTGNLTIGPGRMYIDGLLAENHGDPAAATWDPALAELSGSPQPAPSAETGAISFTSQPWLPGVTLPAGGGTFLAYLDVWTRAVTYLEDSNLIDPAVGIDTTGRLQTVWQVKLAAMNAGVTCATAGSPWPADSSGLLTTAPIANTPSGPCCLTTNTGYTGMENQNYRVEVHIGGPVGTATFKWSRDNASVETGVTGILGVTNSVGVAASQLTVLSMGRDQVLGFAPGNWIEVIDDDLELAGLPGELHLIDTIDFAAKTITLDSNVSAASFPVDGSNQTTPSRHTRIRRWDQSGKVFASDGTTLITDLGAAGSTGAIPIPAAGAAVILENGVTVSFSLSSSTGSFNTGDFWTFAARTADGSIEQLNNAPPRGIHHHYTGLSVVNFATGTATDCRNPFEPCEGGGCGCCTVTVGDGVESFGQYTSINDAIKALPDAGGEVCILPGRYYEHVFIEGCHDVIVHGCGYQTRLASPSLQPAPPPPAPMNQAAGQPAAPPAAAPAPPPGQFNAVISISSSAHIQLRDFAVEADTDEVGILIDGTGDLVVQPGNVIEVQAASNNPAVLSSAQAFNIFGAIDITVEDLFLTASTLPAILAKLVRLLRIDDNRVAMQDVASIWPAIWVSGQEIHIDRNFVGIQSTAIFNEWMSTAVTNDLASSPASASAEATTTAAAPATATAKSSNSSASQKVAAQIAQKRSKATAKQQAANPAAVMVQEADTAVFLSAAVAKNRGGIQIGGRSRSVFVIDNLIQGGRGNGITLGSFDVLDANGNDTSSTIGVIVLQEDPCSTTGTLQPPTTVPTGTGTPGGSIVAGGPLIDILIDHNRILNMGMCGIGPVGFFDLRTVFEIITIENLTITSNTITNVLLRDTAAVNTFGTAASSQASASTNATDTTTSSFATVGTVNAGTSTPYGAISVSSVENLVIRDNAITNFGSKPGIAANGIFILIGEMVEISRNQILETRDWTQTTNDTPVNPGGIHGGIVIAIVTPPSITNATALTASSNALFEPGLPALRVEENVVRVALGQAFVALGLGPFAISNNHFTCGGTIRGRGTPMAQTVLILNLGTAIEAAATTRPSGVNSGLAGYAVAESAPTLSASSNGTVLFTNNICQLEARADRQRSITSVTIISTDNLIFSNNQLWFDSATIDAFFDAFLAAGTLTATGNRFQESAASVYLSGLTVAPFNITTQNISTFCLLVSGANQINTSNLAIVNAFFNNICASLQKQ
ncbi:MULTISPECIES: DUF6519 domain-containing protein [Acidobacteriaceae]|uniref:DUF6519 domain-containing protein n=1 Tax=Acidobacteriaceae TaxID=204434 RepID=UPI00131A9A97|nr:MULTISPECIES: DUF6519 domain-containing protein [Acidobacteriaceae]MDW5265450.1 DUF6519 domain-containing protein [Edaphobacter sp.]